MSKSKAKIWARLISKGQKTLDDVEQTYWDVVRDAYFELFGEEL